MLRHRLIRDRRGAVVMGLDTEHGAHAQTMCGKWVNPVDALCADGDACYACESSEWLARDAIAMAWREDRLRRARSADEERRGRRQIQSVA